MIAHHNKNQRRPIAITNKIVYPQIAEDSSTSANTHSFVTYMINIQTSHFMSSNAFLESYVFH